MKYFVVLVALLVPVIVMVGACGGNDEPAVPPPTSAAAATTSPTPTTFGGIVGDAAAQACVSDAQTVQSASDAYAASNGRPAASIDALVTAGVLRAAPSADHGYVIGYDAATGHVTARGACSVP